MLSLWSSSLQLGWRSPDTCADRLVEQPRSSDDRIAAELRGFGLLGILAIVVILAGNAVFIPLSGVLVLLWAWRRKRLTNYRIRVFGGSFLRRE